MQVYVLSVIHPLPAAREPTADEHHYASALDSHAAIANGAGHGNGHNASPWDDCVQHGTLRCAFVRDLCRRLKHAGPAGEVRTAMLPDSCMSVLGGGASAGSTRAEGATQHSSAAGLRCTLMIMHELGQAVPFCCSMALRPS